MLRTGPDNGLATGGGAVQGAVKSSSAICRIFLHKITLWFLRQQVKTTATSFYLLALPARAGKLRTALVASLPCRRQTGSNGNQRLLLLDGTAKSEILRQFVPHLEDVSE